MSMSSREGVVGMVNAESSSLIGFAILRASFDDQRQVYLDNFE